MVDIRRFSAIGKVELELKNECARIRVLALDDGKQIFRDEEFIAEVCPPRGMAFGPSFFKKYPHLSKGEIIRFKLAPNRIVDEFDDAKDHTIISEGTPVESDFGYPVIKTNGKELVDNHIINLDFINQINVPGKSRFYFWSTHGLSGPFKKKKEEVKPAVGKTVERWPEFAPDDSFVASGGDQVLLREPSGYSVLVDCMTPKQLNEWFRSKIKLLSNELLDKLPATKLKDLSSNLIEDISGEDNTELIESRLRRIVLRFEQAELERNEIESLVSSSETFKELFNRSLDKQRDLIFAEAIEPLEKKADQLKVTITQVESMLKAKQEEVKQLEKRKKSLEKGISKPSSEDVNPQSFIQANKIISVSSRKDTRLEVVGPGTQEYKNPGELIKSYTGDLTECWYKADEVAKEMVKSLRISRCHFVEDSQLPLSLAHHINNVKYCVLQIEPDWLRFLDFWDSGLKTIWESAQEATDFFHFLIIRDINLASPECWAKPLLDLWTGNRTSLPYSEGGWPDNLWIFATRVSSEPPHDIGLPLYKKNFRQWAVLKANRKKYTRWLPQNTVKFWSIGAFREFAQGHEGIIHTTDEVEDFFDYA